MHANILLVHYLTSLAHPSLSLLPLSVRPRLMHSLLLAACLCSSPPLNGEHNDLIAIFSLITRMGLSDSAYLALLPTCLSCPMFKTFLSAKYPVYLSYCLSNLLLVAYSAYSFVFLPYSAYSNVCLPLNLLFTVTVQVSWLAVGTFWLAEGTRLEQEYDVSNDHLFIFWL